MGGIIVVTIIMHRPHRRHHIVTIVMHRPGALGRTDLVVGGPGTSTFQVYVPRVARRGGVLLEAGQVVVLTSELRKLDLRTNGGRLFM